MIKYLTKENEALLELDAPKGACWICILPDFTGADLMQWAHQLRIPGSYLTDILDAEKLPRYEVNDDTIFLLVRTPVLLEIEDAEDPIYKTAPIVVILKSDFIITACAYDSPVLKTFLNEEIDSFDLSDKVQFVLHLLERNVLYYLECLKHLDARRDTLESQLFDSSQTCELQRLLGIDKSLIYFVNSLSANANLKKKIWKNDLLKIRQDPFLRNRFEDIRLDNAQALEIANMYTNILNGIMETYGTIISNNLSITLGRLTVVTIVLMVPTLIASFYGMNVSLPFQKNPNTFFLILTLALMLSVLLSWYFLKRRLF